MVASSPGGKKRVQFELFEVLPRQSQNGYLKKEREEMMNKKECEARIHPWRIHGRLSEGR